MVSRRRALVAGSVVAVCGPGCLGTGAGGETTRAGGPTDGTDVEGSDADGDRRVRITVAGDGEERELVTGEDVAAVGAVERSRQAGFRVPVRLTDDGSEAFVSGLERSGALDEPSAHEIRTFLDGDRVTTATLGADLAAEVESGAWDGRLVVHVSDRDEAERLRAALDDA